MIDGELIESKTNIQKTYEVEVIVKLKFNWKALLEHHPQLRDYKAPCYIVECKKCEKLFTLSNM